MKFNKVEKGDVIVILVALDEGEKPEILIDFQSNLTRNLFDRRASKDENVRFELSENRRTLTLTFSTEHFVLKNWNGESFLLGRKPRMHPTPPAKRPVVTLANSKTPTQPKKPKAPEPKSEPPKAGRTESKTAASPIGLPSSLQTATQPRSKTQNPKPVPTAPVSDDFEWTLVEKDEIPALPDPPTKKCPVTGLLTEPSEGFLPDATSLEVAMTKSSILDFLLTPAKEEKANNPEKKLDRQPTPASQIMFTLAESNTAECQQQLKSHLATLVSHKLGGFCSVPDYNRILTVIKRWSNGNPTHDLTADAWDAMAILTKYRSATGPVQTSIDPIHELNLLLFTPLVNLFKLVLLKPILAYLQSSEKTAFVVSHFEPMVKEVITSFEKEAAKDSIEYPDDLRAWLASTLKPAPAIRPEVGRGKTLAL